MARGSEAAPATDETLRLLEVARRWLEQDPDEQTRDELTALIDASESGDGDATAQLQDRFATRLAFGTAGLRGELGAGSNRMNRVVVTQASAGIAAYLAERAGERAPLVVVGYDGRRNSDVFARDAAEIFAGSGARAVLLPRMLPTPVLAFAVRYLGADAGVQITASHNPPNDNGYKVYLGGDDQGAQLVSPADAEIARHIDRIAEVRPIGDLPRRSDIEIAGDDVVAAYLDRVADVAPAPPGAADLRWTYTAMHGVGWETLSAAVARAGYAQPVTVAEQRDPDGAFPTVAFPNPEEPGALDLAIRTATESGSELIVANDPDADRLAVAVPDGTEPGGWRALTGNQLGLLLGWWAAQRAVDNDPAPGASLSCSLVSSPGLALIAERFGLESHETLTGFKWIARAPGMVYGFEEALGYLVDPDSVRDKDGISAALAVLALAALARAEGKTLGDRLTELSEEIGYFASGQVSIRFNDIAERAAIMARLRTNPPARIGDTAITAADDLLSGAAGLPPGDVLRYWLEDGARVIVRPSGTEPKLKAYLDVRGTDDADARARLERLTAAARELVS